MASRFSGALQLTDLDDFITPSQVTYYVHFNLLLKFSYRNSLRKYIFFLGMHQTCENRKDQE